MLACPAEKQFPTLSLLHTRGCSLATPCPAAQPHFTPISKFPFAHCSSAFLIPPAEKKIKRGGSNLTAKKGTEPHKAKP